MAKKFRGLGGRNYGGSKKGSNMGELLKQAQKAQEEMESLERVALSIGLSLALVPLVGLLLNYTPWGITLTPIMISLAFLSEGLAFAALVRKYHYYTLSLK